MARGTYLHGSRHPNGEMGLTYDGVPEGSDTKLFACESRELGLRALRLVHEENEGDRLDRFFAVKRSLLKAAP